MSAARDQLIADWQSRLAAAEALAAESPQFAWLARVRIRLYRFLLSCYGAGDWNPPRGELPNELSSESPAETSSAIFDSTAGRPLHGKPAKSAGKIQAVLKSVANAQDQPPAPGPLTGGLDATCWVVVASASSNVHLERFTYFLRVAGIAARRRVAGDDEFVEVRASDRQDAIGLLERNREGMWIPRGRLTQVRSDLVRMGGWAAFAGGMGLLLFLITFVGLALFLEFDDWNDSALVEETLRTMVALGYCAFAILMFLAACAAGRLLNRIEQSLHSNVAQNPQVRIHYHGESRPHYSGERLIFLLGVLAGPIAGFIACTLLNQYFPPRTPAAAARAPLSDTALFVCAWATCVLLAAAIAGFPAGRAAVRRWATNKREIRK